MSDAIRRGWVRTAGLAAAVPVLSFSLCPVREEQEHVDIRESFPLNAVGQLAIPDVSSGPVSTAALTGVQATGEVGSFDLDGLSPLKF